MPELQERGYGVGSGTATAEARTMSVVRFSDNNRATNTRGTAGRGGGH
ncbi:hypothetical protein ACFWFF_06720 [Streptomyces sp. NPDC060223]